MSLLVLVGWTATAVGTVLGIPQLVRLARTRNVEGLSLVGWQAILAINLGWTAHGIRIGQPPQIVASAFSLVATLPILYMLARELGRRTLPTLAGPQSGGRDDRRLGLRAFFAPAELSLPQVATACDGAPAAEAL